MKPWSTSKQNTKPNADLSTRLVNILADQEKQRGLKPMPLEADLLLKRIEQGGQSGDYLADAFNSTYRNIPFGQSLFDIIHLDAEAFRLFHEILHIRHVPGWSDDELFVIERKIKAIREAR
ncbi:hypothetical protein [Methylotuvimicrobium sp. KM1]|uniref:hypothetical protein n=1 Tax=unclassified Methylotuvimicrobium TaxID=2822412 RepID=UPI00384C3A5D